MEPFELYAIRYGQSDMRTKGENMVGADMHEPHSALDYFIWVAKRSDRAFLIDTGMSAKTSAERKINYMRAPPDAIGLLGLDPATLDDIILTHLHFDHAGMLDRYPKARLHIQDGEISYATGRCMCSKLLRRGYELPDVLHLVTCVYADQVAFHDPVSEVTSGLSVHRVGGHTGGLQVVRVWTQRGWVVLASDASHLYANMMGGTIFPSIFRVDEMMQGYRTVLSLANGNWDNVIPGHDPMVMALYPPPSADLEGIIVRLDVPPRNAV